MTLIEAFMKKCAETETPEPFDIINALFCTNCLLGRKTWFDYGEAGDIFPNLYVIIVSEPGLGKSTAMGISENLLRKIGKVSRTASRITKEALIMNLARVERPYVLNHNGSTQNVNQAYSLLSEFTGFLGGKSASHDMVDLLVDLYDRTYDWSNETIKHGEVVIQFPHYSFLGCCTKDWVDYNLKSEVIGGGFVRRCIFVYETMEKNIVPLPRHADPEIDIILEREATRIAKLQGSFGLTKAAREIYEEFYYNLKKEKHDPKTSEKVRFYLNSKAVQLLKICMGFSANFDDSLLIDSNIVKSGIKVLDYSERNLGLVLGSVGHNEMKPLSDKVMQFIQQAGTKGILDCDLKARFYNDMSLSELDVVIGDLTILKTVVSSLTGGEIRHRSIAEVTTQKTIDLSEIVRLARPQYLTPQSDLPIRPPVDQGMKQHLSHLTLIEERTSQGVLLTEKPLTHHEEVSPVVKMEDELKNLGI